MQPILRIAFTSIHLSERGTTTALLDYARYNEDLLHNKSIILYQPGHPSSFGPYEEYVKSNFECYALENFQDTDKLDALLSSLNVHAFYVIKSGRKDGIVSKRVPTLVHAVFSSDPHGDRYAYISEWLTNKYNSLIPTLSPEDDCILPASRHSSTPFIPYVPHMISLPHLTNNTDNLRSELGIPEDATVFGGYGGKDSFDLPFVHRAIEKVVVERPSIYFLFMNFARSTFEHPHIIYLPPSINLEYKAKFIRTCDCMLHGRSVGETFGLAVGEFSSFNKPVMSWDPPRHFTSYDREHLRILGEKCIYYTNYDHLVWNLLNFRRIASANRSNGWNAYAEYTPQKVMKIFETVFLKGLSS